MKKMNCAVYVAMALVLVAGNSFAAANKGKGEPAAQAVQSASDVASKATETFFSGCETELSTFCKEVTPGEGRLLACLYAHSDKISNRCEYAVYDAAAQLERYLSNLTYLASECGDDLEKYCADTQPGEGRLANCIDKNKDKISKRCSQAIKDVNRK